MKKYRVKVAFRVLETYEIEAEDREAAIDLWAEGRLVRTDDDPVPEVLFVKEA